MFGSRVQQDAHERGPDEVLAMQERVIRKYRSYFFLLTSHVW